MTTYTTHTQHSIPRNVRRLWLVRHGQTDWNEQGRFCGHTDIPLSTIGREQARRLAARLQHLPIISMYTSDLQRARQTAEYIAKSLQKREVGKPGTSTLNVIVSPAWREINFGQWEGLTYNEIAALSIPPENFFNDPEHFSPPSGETAADVATRTLSALRLSMQDEREGDSVLVSHGGTLRILLCTLLGMPLRNHWQLRVDTGSLSALDLSLDEHSNILTSLVGLNVSMEVG